MSFSYLLFLIVFTVDIQKCDKQPSFKKRKKDFCGICSSSLYVFFLIGEFVKSHGVTDLIDENILKGSPFIELIL